LFFCKKQNQFAPTEKLFKIKLAECQESYKRNGEKEIFIFCCIVLLLYGHIVLLLYGFIAILLYDIDKPQYSNKTM